MHDKKMEILMKTVKNMLSGALHIVMLHVAAYDCDAGVV